MGRRQKTRIGKTGNKPFLENKMNDYTYRPTALEEVNLYDFTMLYNVELKSKRNKNSRMELLEEHDNHAIRCVVKLPHPITPLVSFLDFTDASNFKGNILDPTTEENPENTKFAKAALALFIPFRDDTKFCQIPSVPYLTQFREAYQHGQLSDVCKQRLQNIQVSTKLSHRFHI